MRAKTDAQPRDVGTALERWGIATVGALAMLPAAEVALRLGAAGARLHRLASGVDDESFVPQLPADALEEETELDYTIYEIEPLSFVLRGLVDRALARLACRSLACAGITLRLKLDPRGLDVREILIAAPTREASTLLELVRLDLARRPPDAGVVGAALIALPARVRSTQLDFLRPAGPAPDRLAATLARLAALVGPENVGAPQAPDTWREEAIAVAPYSVAGASRAPELPAARSALAVRRFRPAQEIEVLMGRDGPTALRGTETTARVLIAAGPYRLRGEWWRPPEEDGDFARDYWDVHASDGAVYRLHQDSRSGRWFLDGYYD
jgi:protein ImuB